MNTSTLRSVFCAALCSVSMAWAAPDNFAVGEPLPSLTIQNQHHKSWGWNDSTRLVILAKGRAPANWVMDVVGPKGQGFLASRQAVYLADMSKMPGFITRSFALPALREQPFEVGVVMDDKALAAWPQQADTLTLVHLDRSRVVSHEFVTDAAGLRRALGL
jgi:hypothetical protein